jgi:ATP-binding cassette subfamily C (CFTR/MRP) protein 1
VFKNFCSSYESITNPIIQDVSIEINAGEKVAVVGRSGAGKSSLTLALFRLMPETSGSVSIDDIDLSVLDRRSFRPRLTIIPQEPLLLTGSLRLNLDPFNVHSDSQLFFVLRQANLTSFAVPGGLEHQLVDSGINWSVGQRQQLCLARALLNRSKILVLDEATASLDPETENLIQNTIKEQFSDCTVVAIAHRLNFVFSYSRVLVLDAGRVVEFDSPKVLMDNKESAFYALARESGLA